MRVCFYPASVPPYDACAQYRLLLPAAALRAQGMDVVEGERQLPVTRRGDAVIAAEPLPADVAVFQRMSLPDTVACFKHWQRQGTAIVVDVDDLISGIPRNNPAWDAFNGNVHWRHLDEACDLADLVTVSTPALAERYGKHGRVRVLRNCVPERYLSVHAPTAEGNGPGSDRVGAYRDAEARFARNSSRPPVLGWAGNTAIHRDDLKVVGSAVSTAVQRTGARFRAIGDPLTLQFLGVEGDVAPWVGFEHYPEELVALDVGMAPLADSPFNRAKSALKMIEGAACGVAMVGSPSPEYRWAHAQGIGLLADTPRQWRGTLVRLLGDLEWRTEVAGRSREAMRAWTYERHADDWWLSWDQALTNRRAAHGASVNRRQTAPV